jgi:CheY-like chemotaxis protein
MIGKQILVVEDDYSIAQAAADQFLDAQAARVFTVPSVPAALEVIANHSVHLATLDIKLRNEECFPIADVLAERGIPFAFLSGEVRAGIPDRFAAYPLLSKAEHLTSLVERLAQLLKVPAAQPCRD